MGALTTSEYNVSMLCATSFLCVDVCGLVKLAKHSVHVSSIDRFTSKRCTTERPGFNPDLVKKLLLVVLCLSLSWKRVGENT